MAINHTANSECFTAAFMAQESRQHRVSASSCSLMALRVAQAFNDNEVVCCNLLCFHTLKHIRSFDYGAFRWRHTTTTAETFNLHVLSAPPVPKSQKCPEWHHSSSLYNVPVSLSLSLSVSVYRIPSPLPLCRTSSTTWPISRTTVWSRSLTPKGTTHGRSTSRRRPRRSWTSSPCVMGWSPSTRPWRMLLFGSLTSECGFDQSRSWTVGCFHTQSSVFHTCLSSAVTLPACRLSTCARACLPWWAPCWLTSMPTTLTPPRQRTTSLPLTASLPLTLGWVLIPAAVCLKFDFCFPGVLTQTCVIVSVSTRRKSVLSSFSTSFTTLYGLTCPCTE